MVILTDDQQNPMSQPTKQNILKAMHWLVKDAKTNDSLFFHYSGICPPHFSSKVIITDDEHKDTGDKHRILTETKTMVTTRRSIPWTSDR